MHLRRAVRTILGMSTLAAACAVAAQDEPQQTAGIEEIIVTAQKREESIQSVPIAVTALTADALTTQKINLAQDLPRAVPNLYFSRAGLGFNETNLQLRGIGYQLVNTSGDAGVGVHVNNAPLGVSRLGQSELYDIERIEVLRGPQGTLYGRNATGGVVNIITAKPSVEAYSGEWTIEYGNYDHKRLAGHLNMPFGELAALRIAAFGLMRDGYSENTLGGNIDGRQMWSGRTTLALNPQGAVRAMLMWEHSDEDDDRIGNTKALCIKDTGPTSVGGVAINSPLARQFMSRGCSQGSIYSDAAYDSVNYGATLAGILGTLGGVVNGDIYSGVRQSTDLREIAMSKQPEYKATNDLYEFNLELDLTSTLKVTALTSYLEDSVDTRATGAGYAASQTFNVTAVTPGGVFNDPQLGRSNTPEVLWLNDLDAKQWSQELRLQSAFEGPLNFNVGGIYMSLERLNDVFIIPNSQNAYIQLANLANLSPCLPNDCYLDANHTPDGTGHNYYLSRNPYELTATAFFGEIYWDIGERFTLTTGVRYTDDKKEIDLHPVTMLTPGRGWAETGPLAIVDQEAQFREWTGRVNGAWRVTDANLLYASYSKGYKGGGINTPDAATGNRSPTYQPEFVNAYEVGSKNEFFDGNVQLNLTGFYYDYQNYQISQQRGLTSTTENVDVAVHGLELETVWQATDGLRLNSNIGWLATKLTEGASVDTFDRTQGNPALTLVKSTSSACVVPTAAMATFINLMNNGTPFIPVAGGGARAATAQDILGICAGSFSGLGLTPTEGVAVDLEGKELPQAPELTASVGGEYRFDFTSGWSATLRADYYYQTDAFTRIYNSESDRLRSWDNANASLIVANDTLGWRVQAYAKNLLDDDVITGFDTSSDALGLVRNVSVLDPRLFGIVVTKSF